MQDDTQTDLRPFARARVGVAFWLITIVLAFTLGVLFRSVDGTSSVNAADSTPDADATHSAELSELNELRTKVAQTVVCIPPTSTPSPTPTETPTPSPTATLVPAQPMGTDIPYGKNLILNVVGAATVRTPDGIEVEGQLLQVSVEFGNATDVSRQLPFDEFRLIDGNGNRYKIDFDTSTEILGLSWNLYLEANQTEERSLFFDIPLDAGTQFVLVSTERPEFRIEIILEVRG